MKNTKTTLLMLLTILGGLNPVSQAQVNSNQYSIDELSTAAEALTNSIRLEVQEKAVTFPDYKEVYAAYLDEAQKDLANFKTALGDVKNTAQTELSRIETEYQSVKSAYDQDPSRANAELLKLEVARTEKAKAALKATLNQKYSSALAQLISLGGRLRFPCVKRMNAATGVLIGSVILIGVGMAVFLPASATQGAAINSANALYDAGGITWAEATAAVGGTSISTAGAIGLGGSAALGISTTAILTSEADSDHFLGGGIGLGRRVRDNLGTLVSTHGGYKRISNNAAQTIFKECTTAGCVLHISEEYQNWMTQTATLNRDISLGQGFELKKLPAVRQSKIDKAFWALTQGAARAKGEVTVLK
jgi:hypothetical protein